MAKPSELIGGVAEDQQNHERIQALLVAKVAERGVGNAHQAHPGARAELKKRGIPTPADFANLAGWP